MGEERESESHYILSIRAIQAIIDSEKWYYCFLYWSHERSWFEESRHREVKREVGTICREGTLASTWQSSMSVFICVKQ